MKGSAFPLVMALLPALVFTDRIDEVAGLHQVDARLVRAITQVESRIYADAVDTNNDDSADIGPMQTNSSWLPSPARYGIIRAHLLGACVNAYAGSWILSHNTQQLDLTWDTVGACSTKSPVKRFTCTRKVYQALATASSTPNRAVANPVVSIRPTETPRAAARRLQTSTSSNTTIAP